MFHSNNIKIILNCFQIIIKGFNKGVIFYKHNIFDEKISRLRNRTDLKKDIHNKFLLKGIIFS